MSLNSSLPSFHGTPYCWLGLFMGIKNQYTKVKNKIDQQIDFVVDSGLCLLHSLPAGKSQRVSLSLILKECKKHGSATWPIHVLINNDLCGIHLHPRDHILRMTSIVFRYKWRPDGSRIPIAEGVLENYRDRMLDCCIKLLTRLLIFFPFFWSQIIIF